MHGCREMRRWYFDDRSLRKFGTNLFFSLRKNYFKEKLVGHILKLVCSLLLKEKDLSETLNVPSQFFSLHSVRRKIKFRSEPGFLCASEGLKISTGTASLSPGSSRLWQRAN